MTIANKIILPIICFIILTGSVVSCQNTNNEQGNTSTSQTATSEPLLAKTTMVFVDNAEKGEYAVSLAVEMGTLKVGQKLDAVGNGKKYVWKI